MTHNPNQASLFEPGSPALQRSLAGLKPRRKLGSPGPQDLEGEARDIALDRIAKWRTGLVAIARDVAVQIARQRHRVTSVEVFAEMRAQGYDEALDAVDPRWMGAVFNEEIWSREGWETTGSHKRPVAIWSLRDPRNIPPSPRELVYRVVSSMGEEGATVEGIVASTALKGSHVRNCLKDLEILEKVLPVMRPATTRGGRKTKDRRVYVLPEHHPDII
jgi:hypothetical protein